ncbi:hypothetical protein VOLCADRAFT_121172 [Volvox carteri f. nagariensis]|uniref:tRNA-binding domain-containing protein n=1 Tax=Volvox carteri f. nagariensis TaxID=3068 RepID=D8U415_VOLCA|nr:uncharacterized protein VOLCADRAFT_121172 [Volvox carteri f. nagariensis]EFJ45517.1 hypothetical protein VOLCADRAFT_121172 [Volvox carteri f. nagariensis]|eukprot:XP_002953544.1 hypothetical protein VOLCADRAFT_121172 [Volvox carteri f. nagariensis]
MSGHVGPAAAACFVAHCLGSAEQPTTSTSGQVQLAAGNGSVISGLATVCTHLVRQSSGKHSLLGPTPEMQAQVTAWLTWATIELTPLMDDKLLKLDQHLTSCTYLVGGSATLADLVIYGLVHPAVTSFPAAQTLHFCNLLRWYDLLQNTVDTNGFFQPRLSLKKPHYVAPPPPAPPAPKAAPPAAAPAAAAPAKGAPAEATKVVAAPAKGAKAEAAAGPAAAAATAAAAADCKPAASADKEAKGAGKKDGGKEAKSAGGKGAAAAAPAIASSKAGEEEATIDMLDCRVGRIIKVDKHPNADALYLEEIDVGEEKPRQVISGLRNFVPLEQMQDRVVVVVCNLKPAKMRDIMSYGMVLCASDDAHGKVEPVIVPEGVPIGERLTVEGYLGSPPEEINPKKKILERLFPDMKTDEAGTPVYKGKPFMTSKGPLSSSVQSGWVK